MTLTSAIAIFFVIWWVMLFATLPWGVRTQHDEADVVPGSAPSAPMRPLLLRKFIATTIVSAIVFAVLYWVITEVGITADAVPFLPRFG